MSNTATVLKTDAKSLVDDIDNTLTHPMMYRQAINETDTATYNYTTPMVPSKAACNPEEANWDCYPGLVREIENEGSPEQVERLHQMEHPSPSSC
ncbi:hypothetical protein EC973_001401 [Apophysomyces ossiformis]|uniref:Uncharacterized protein n=1 Tax=Apophysomyces ossiformis TaxID=679940 RepID=A0A8H7BKE5_9FUNG|nr:hypothetical protein EC973_001401 [Apophysomyces ossiformis]